MIRIRQARERVIIVLQLVAVLLGGLICASLSSKLLPYTPGRVEHALDVLPYAKVMITLFDIRVDNRGAIRLIAFVAGCLLFWFHRGAVLWVANRLFPAFDFELLRPIRKPGSLDPIWLPAIGTDNGTQPLDWVEPPPASLRRPVWDKLRTFLSLDVGDGRLNIFGQPVSPFVRFKWILLAGGPGSGKTRMATEISRARARREILGQDSREGRPARRKLIIGAWARSTWPLSARRETFEPAGHGSADWCGSDPWDAGWLVSNVENPGTQNSQRSSFDDGLMPRIKAWRPRRPTVILLDDPLPGDAGRVIAALLSGESAYQHPVRLIVVSQVVPQEVGLERISDEIWRSDTRAFCGQVGALSGLTPLNAAEVRLMVGSLKLSGHWLGWRPTDQNVLKLLLSTRGNALLVCLSLQMIQRSAEVEAIDVNAVLLDRAQRIIGALKVAGIGKPEHLRAIACISLASSGDRGFALPMNVLPDDWPPFEHNVSMTVPNLDPSWPTPLPPAVRPTLIGDAFVRLVLSDRYSDAEARKHVIEVAWRLSPSNMVSASQRLSAMHDVLGEALRAGPPHDANVHPVELAMAYATAAILRPRSQWEAGALLRPGRALATALRAIRTISSQEATALVSKLAAFEPVHSDYATVSGRAIQSCVHAAIRRGLQSAQSWKASEDVVRVSTEIVSILKILGKWGIDGNRDLRPMSGRVLGLLIDRAASGLNADSINAIIETVATVAWQPDWAAKGDAAFVLDALSKLSIGCGTSDTMASARRHRLSAQSAALRDAVNSCWASRACLEELKPTLALRREFELERVMTWRAVAYTQRASQNTCETIGRKVDSLTKPFGGERVFELERAIAWRYVAQSNGKDLTGCERAAHRVEEVAASFHGDYDFELERVKAWCIALYALEGSDLNACKDAADFIYELINRFSGEAEFEVQRVKVLRKLAEAQEDDTSTCEKQVRLIDGFESILGGTREFELERAQAWGLLARVHGKNLALGEAAIDMIDYITKPFYGERAFAVERVRARRYAVSAKKNDFVYCESAARGLDAIARPFRGQMPFELERTIAWRMVAASSNIAERCEQIALLVDRLAKSFSGQRDFELERARAWGAVAYQKREDPLGSESAARLIDGIARPFAHQRDFELGRATAWQNVAFACKTDVLKWKYALRQIERSMRGFQEDEDFKRIAANARSFRP